MRKLAVLLILILPLVVMPQSVFRGNSKISGSKIGAPSTPPSVVVSGAGTTAANGTYTYTGEHNGRPYYNKVGSGPEDSAISYEDGWNMFSAIGTNLYLNGGEDVAFPWLSAAWQAGFGDDPPPVVTQGN